MRWTCLAAIALLLPLRLWGAQELAVDLEYPAFQGDFYAAGTISFPPGAAPAADCIMVADATSRREIASKIDVLQQWPDGSVLKANVLFAANVVRQVPYIVLYGENVRRSKTFSEPAVLPTVSFSVGGAPKTAETLDVNVGDINVRVDRSPGIYYYWHVAPIAALILLTLYRARKVKQAQ